MAEISSEFEYSASFLKIYIPGIIVVTLTSFIFILNYPQYINIFKEGIAQSIWNVLPIGTIFIFISIIVGLLMSVLIIPFTMVLEGYYLEKFSLKDILKENQWKTYVSYFNKFNSTSTNEMVERGLIYRKIYYYFSSCLYELHVNKNINEDELKKCILATKLGNVFRSIEIYPKWKYGMDSVFFWTRIQLLLSDENKTTIDKKRSFVDLFITLTWIFFFAAIVYLIVLAYKGNYFLSIGSFVLFSLFAYGSYNMAVESALKFGYYVRSIFDLYREDLWNKIKSKQFNKLDSLQEKERWESIFGHLWFFNTIECQKCGKIYESITEHKCNDQNK